MDTQSSSPIWTCECHHNFLLPQVLSVYQCSCSKTKKWLAEALQSFKDVFRKKKHQKTQENPSKANQPHAKSSQPKVAVPIAPQVRCIRYLCCAMSWPWTHRIPQLSMSMFPWTSLLQSIVPNENTVSCLSTIKTCFLNLMPHFLHLTLPIFSPLYHHCHRLRKPQWPLQMSSHLWLSPE